MPTAYEIAKSAILGNPVDPQHQPSPTGVIDAFAEIQKQIGATFTYRADAVNADVPTGITSIYVQNYTAIGDGLGGIYVTTNNGSLDTFTTLDGRTWYRSTDVDTTRFKYNHIADAPVLVNKKLMELNFGFDNGVDPSTEIYPGAGLAVQGYTIVVISGVRYAFVTQRCVAPGTYVDGELCRIVKFQLKTDGTLGNALAWSQQLNIGHGQDLGYYWVGSVLYFVCFFPTSSTRQGDDAGKGVSLIRWREGFDQTAQADVVSKQLFGYNDNTAHQFSSFNHFTAGTTADTNAIIGVANCVDDNSRWFFSYDRAQVVASGSPLTLLPTRRWRIENVPVGQNTALQGIASDGQYVYIAWGYYAPFGSQCLQIYSMDGDLIRTIFTEHIKVSYGRANLLNHATYGIPRQIEMEGCAIYNGRLSYVVLDTWQAASGTSIVTFGEKITTNGRGYATPGQYNGVALVPVGAATGSGATADITVSSTINTTSLSAGGSGYVNGTYTNVPLTGGAGTGAKATIVVSGGAVTSVTVTDTGLNYAATNVLSCDNVYLGGTGSGFTVTVSTTTGTISKCKLVNGGTGHTPGDLAAVAIGTVGGGSASPAFRFSFGKNYAYIGSTANEPTENGTRRSPRNPLNWVETGVVSNAGVWGMTATYTRGKVTRRSKVIVETGVKTTDVAEFALLAGISHRTADAALIARGSNPDIVFKNGDTFQVKSWTEGTEEYLNEFSWYDNGMRYYDSRIDADNSRFARSYPSYQLGREFISFTAGENADRGLSLNLYGVNDTSFADMARFLGVGGVERLRVGVGGATLLTSITGIIPLQANRPDTGDMIQILRNGTVYGGLYASTTNFHVVARTSSDLCLSVSTSAAGTPSAKWRVDQSTSAFTPFVDATYNLASAALRINNSYFAVASTVGSDINFKTNFEDITTAEKTALKACAKLIQKYQMKDAVAEKGADVARVHVGVPAQHCVAEFEKVGLDPWRYAFFCRDPKTEPVERHVKVQKPIFERVEVEGFEIDFIDGKAVMRPVTVTEERPKISVYDVNDLDGNPVFERVENRDPNTGKTIVDFIRKQHVVTEMEDAEEITIEHVPVEGEYVYSIRYEQLLAAIIASMLK